MKKISILLLWLLCGSYGYSQILTPVKWSYAVKKTDKNNGVILIKATIGGGWHIYSTKQKAGGPIKTTIHFFQSPKIVFVSNLSEPKPLEKFEKSFGIKVHYFERSVIFKQKIHFKPNSLIKGTINFMVCNEEKCLPPDDVPFEISIQ